MNKKRAISLGVVILLVGGFLFYRNLILPKATDNLYSSGFGSNNIGSATSQQEAQPAAIKIKPTQNTKENNIKTKIFTQPFSMMIDKNKKYTALLKTSAGDISVELAAGKTPITVNNFVQLSKNNFYDGTIFHRVMNGFMIQGGDPVGNGTGGPGYRFDDEPFEGDYTRGIVAMANAGPNTNGSQFFIMHADVPLPKNYVIFGKVISGLNVVDAIATAPVTLSDSGEPSKPVEPVVVTGVVISEK